MTGTSDLLLVVRVAGSLAVVLVVAVLAARVARRLGRGRGAAALAVRERIGLTREASAVVLEVSGRLLLLGVTAHQVALLADLEPAPELEPARGPALGSAALEPAALEPALGPALGPAGGPASALAHVPGQRTTARVVTGAAPATPLTRRELRAVQSRRRAVPPARTTAGSPLDPRTWQQGLEALRDLTARRS
jgi:flagellar protein FliO/FliZ